MSNDAHDLDFIRAQGPAYLAHLLLRLADELVRGGGQWYPRMGVTAPPRTTSTLLALDEHGPLAVTEIAGLLRQSYPLVIDWCRDLTALGFIAKETDPKDRRRTLVDLTPSGRAEVGRLRVALVQMAAASQALMDEAGPGLFDVLWRMEAALRHRRFADRLGDGD